MKNLVIKNDRNYEVFAGNAVSVLDRLPAKIYELYFDEKRGFSLNEADNGFNITQKLYGSVEKITGRVLLSFEKTEGNLGVLISGPKGLGKSLTARKICAEALAIGLPVILVKENLGNIAPFIDTVNQPCVVVLDEFEKHYRNQTKNDMDELENQDSMLNMFDSTLAAKKLFLLTCNDTRNLSEYLLNRPGRIHYHFKAYRLTIDEVRGYCRDNLLPELHGQIPDICALGARIPDFSYDMLRSILFELNTYSCSLEEVQHILNIDTQTRAPFNFKIYFKSGKVETGFEYLNITSTRVRLCWWNKQSVHDELYINASRACWTGDDDGSLVLTGDAGWEKDKKSGDAVQKVLLIPAKKGYLANDNEDDESYAYF